MVLCFQNPHEQLFSDEIRFHHLHGLGNLSQTMPLKLFMINKLKVDSSVTFKGCKAGLVKRLGESKNTKMKTPLCFGLFLFGCLCLIVLYVFGGNFYPCPIVFHYS